MRPRLDQAIAYLRPDLRDEPDEPGARVAELDEDDMPVLRPFAPGLLVSYVIDRGGHFEYVQNRDLTVGGIAEDELHRTGLRNLNELVKERLRVHALNDPAFAATLDGNFEASLILLDDLWDGQIRYLVEHDFVVAIPARDILTFCDSHSTRGLARLRETVRKLWPGGDHLISRSLYRRRGGRWEVVPE